MLQNRQSLEVSDIYDQGRQRIFCVMGGVFVKNNEISKTVMELLEPVLTAQSIELVDVVYQKDGSNWYLRIFIDKPEGIQLADCEVVSHDLSSKLDLRNVIPHQYFLEVSSPGIERPLRKPVDFIRFRGSQIVLKTFEKIEGSKKFQGMLVDFQDDQVILDIGQETVKIPYHLVAQAKLKVF